MPVEEDRDLVVRLRDGDTEALEQLITRWRSRAEAYAYQALHDRQAAEDAVLEAFARIYAVRTDLDESRSFSAYLFTIVRRICIDELRRRRRFPDLPGDLPELPIDSAEDEWIRRFDRLNRIHLLAALSETDRRMLLAFSMEGKSTRQIASEMGMSDVHVRVRLHRIRARLRKGMDQYA